MTMADLISVYVEILSRWGPAVAMSCPRVLLRRDFESKWFNTEN